VTRLLESLDLFVGEQTHLTVAWACVRISLDAVIAA
jgi:hypothetical protein